MMDIHERHENQEAGGEIVVKQIADEPGARNEQRDAAGDERGEICRHVPILLAGGARFASLVVAGDPNVLRRMQHRENSAAVARLRHLRGGVQFEQRGQHEPQKLRERQGERRQPASARPLRESIAEIRAT